ncbi:unnamed protein product [Linum trigynum]|uniref:Uncharacterized protein n=1 Tax=Linum trigynum TaxID=586398 RepID=A0AAV2G858_9ROSI
MASGVEEAGTWVEESGGEKVQSWVEKRVAPARSGEWSAGVARRGERRRRAAAVLVVAAGVLCSAGWARRGR